jgi:hypothetical protein
MRPIRLAPFFIPAVMLLFESATLRQPDADLGLGLALLIAFGLVSMGVVSVLNRDESSEHPSP